MAITYMVLPYYWIRAQLIRIFHHDSRIYNELKMYPRHFFGIRGKKVKGIGDTSQTIDACIYLSNHQSMNDIFIVIDAISKPFRFIAKKELFANPITGAFMKMSKSYPLDRDDPRQSLLLFKEAIKDTENGHSLLAFPEGTRSHQKDMLDFKDGMFSILRKANVPLVPMYIKDSYDSKQMCYEVYFGEPIPQSIYKSMKGTELSAFVRDKMEALKLQAYSN